MNKLLLICSVAALLYGDFAFGMDYDESELYENPWYDSNLDPLKEKTDKEDTSSENPVSMQKLKELLNLEREKVKKYEKALQRSQQLLAEEREKNRQSETQGQRVQTEESDQLLNDFNSKLNLNSAETDKESSEKSTSGLQSQQTNSSNTKEFKFKNFDIHKIAPKQPQDQLFEAIKKGNLSDVINAIKNGANINGQDKNGNTPLDKASQNGHFEIVRFLVENGADIHKRDVLYPAAYKGDENIVKYLVEHGADVSKSNALYAAVSNDHENVVKYLIEHGADINKTDKFGWTPLLLAMTKGHGNIVKYLVEHGANKVTNNVQIPVDYLTKATISDRKIARPKRRMKKK